MLMLMGYARVSTDAQSLEAQMAALKAAGCERLYAEKRSGAETDRKALAKLMKEASPGDTVVVTRLDRLARSTRDLLNLLDRLGKDNIGFKSLRETSVDTTSPQGRLVVNILASISEFERELIHARMTEGRKRAVANGVKFGPKFKLNSFQRQEALARLAAGESQSVIAKTYGVDPATISRLQGKAARFHADLKPLNEQGQPWHAYFSPAWKWIFLGRPIYYYGAFSSDGVRQVIYAQGNPAIF